MSSFFQMGGVVAVKAGIAVFVMILSNLFVTRLVVIFFYVKNIYKTMCICAMLRLFQAAKRSVRIHPLQQSTRTFRAVSVSSLGDGKLENMEYVALEVGVSLDEITRMQELQRINDEIQGAEKQGKSHHAETSIETSRMSSAEVLRSSMTPLGMNNTLNIHRNEGSGSLSSGMSNFMQSSSSVPLDRPLFVNTAMSAQQRIDIYRRLSSPPQDDEPALLFRWS